MCKDEESEHIQAAPRLTRRCSSYLRACSTTYCVCVCGIHKSTCRCLPQGEANRVIGQHQLNRESSRSHSVFMAHTTCVQEGGDGTATVRVGSCLPWTIDSVVGAATLTPCLIPATPQR